MQRRGEEETRNPREPPRVQTVYPSGPVVSGTVVPSLELVIRIQRYVKVVSPGRHSPIRKRAHGRWETIRDGTVERGGKQPRQIRRIDFGHGGTPFPSCDSARQNLMHVPTPTAASPRPSVDKAT